MKKIGTLGEEITAKWLKLQNYSILHQNWYSRWGEIDLIAQEEKSLTLAFVEVKTRNVQNWDYDGLFAISESKQEKLRLTAESFLSRYPNLVDLPCRFDVALLIYKKNKSKTYLKNHFSLIINLNQPIIYENYEFILKNYIKSAF